MIHFVSGRFTACSGTDFAPMFSLGISRGRMYRGISRRGGVMTHESTPGASDASK